VIGVDVDEHRVAMINEGKMPFYYPAVEEWLKEVVGAKKLTASHAPKESIEESDVIVVTVGTPTGSQYQVDYSQIHSAFREVANADVRNKAIIMRSTAVPGTLTKIVLPLLEKETGLKPEESFCIAVCPERILEGQAHRELYELPEIVGGVGPLSNAVASELFSRINPRKKILITSPTGAELAKLFTNIYRYVNFALANEFAIWAERYGEDAHQIIRNANEGYPRSNIPRPGFAGGPCLGKDGFLLDSGTTFSSIVSVAWKLNEAVPQHVVTSLIEELGPLYGKRIAVLGLSFKAESDDLRFSPSVKLVQALEAYGAEVLVHDPHVRDTLSLADTLRNPEAIVLATNHKVFGDLADMIETSGCKVVYDVWGVFDPDSFSKVKYRRFGRAE
jgi:UDP-N-acetyl-D-mannosaminuronic acid dehydrogenase